VGSTRVDGEASRVAPDPRSDHYFRIKSPLGPEIPGTSPGEVLARAQEDENPIVLIASAGGGIQAAAWTARVLTGNFAYWGSSNSKPTICLVPCAGATAKFLAESKYSVRFNAGRRHE
jgi:hypothetical protein